MAGLQRNGFSERDVEQAISVLKKGAYLLKYGRRGKPKFCPFRLANDESLLIWYSGKDEKQLKLSHVSRIIPGQRTAIFQRYPRPDKEYQSFSLIYSDRSLDLICKDKDEADVWFVALKALITNGSYRKWKTEPRSDRISVDSPTSQSRRNSPFGLSSNNDFFHKDPGETQRILIPCESLSQIGLGKAFSDVIAYTAGGKSPTLSESIANSLSSFSYGADNSNGRGSTVDNVRVSLSSAVSSSSHGSGREDFDSLGDVFIWGEGLGDGILGGGTQRVGSSSVTKMDALFPKVLESSVVLDAHNIACGSKHAVLVTKHGEIFSWGEELGGRLGHGVEADVSQPKLINALSGMNIDQVTCGEYHTCAVTLSGDLYTWGDGSYSSGLLGHGSESSHWIPKKVSGQMEGIHVSSVSCGPWHTAAITSSGQLFTFGDGTFGALGHGDRSSASMPREVEVLQGFRTIGVACGVWHTAAIVEVMDESSGSANSAPGRLFTWGDGDKGRLGHGDDEPRLIPGCVAALVDESLSQVACGHDITVVLTSSGRVYTMGSTVYGQLGNTEADGKLPTCIEGKLSNCFVEEIACGSHHIAVLTSKPEVYTWGKGANGQLGHGDNNVRHIPTLVEALKDKQVKSVVCGSNFTAIICLHKWVPNADNSLCSGCHNQFGFRRKRHNCYNCGLVFCKACSSRKSLKASLAPNINKPYRVCDDCFHKLKKVVETRSVSPLSKVQGGILQNSSSEVAEKESLDFRLNGQTMRLSSVESFKQIEVRQSKHNKKSETNNNRFSPFVKGNSLWGNLSLPTSTSSMFGVIPATAFDSKVASRSTSPISSSPLYCAASSLTVTPSPEITADDPNHTSDSINQEIIKLRAQVEKLTLKSRLLEAELEITSSQLKEAMSTAGNETAKCKAAKEVIKSLTAQLKEMAERVSEGSTANSGPGSIDMQTASIPGSVMKESNLSSLNSPTLESNGLSVNPVSRNRTKSQTDPAEWVIQDEPGVYLTLSSLPGGGKELKRVRFSRKHFTQTQAEKWWTENFGYVCTRHDIRKTDT